MHVHFNQDLPAPWVLIRNTDNTREKPGEDAVLIIGPSQPPEPEPQPAD